VIVDIGNNAPTGTGLGDEDQTLSTPADMRALAEQASEMGQIVSRAAMDAAKPKA
jgi:hypothetical protein